MRTPNDLKPGDRIQIIGFRDEHRMRAGLHNGIYKPIMRWATFVRKLRCGYELRFDRGYTEHWSYVNMLYGLNGYDIPSVYSPHGLTPEHHIYFLETGGRSGWSGE